MQKIISLTLCQDPILYSWRKEKHSNERKNDYTPATQIYDYSLLLANEWSVFFLLCLEGRHNQPVYLCAKHCIWYQPLGTVGKTVWSWTFLRDRNAVNCHTFGQNKFIKKHVTILVYNLMRIIPQTMLEGNSKKMKSLNEYHVVKEINY